MFVFFRWCVSRFGPKLFKKTCWIPLRERRLDSGRRLKRDTLTPDSRQNMFCDHFLKNI